MTDFNFNLTLKRIVWLKTEKLKERKAKFLMAYKYMHTYVITYSHEPRENSTIVENLAS